MKVLSGGCLLVLAALVLAGSAGPATSHSQKIVFGSNRADGQRDLYVVNEDGSGEHRLTFDGEDYRERAAAWSPDGSRIAYTALHDGNADVYTIDANGGDRRRLTTDPARDDDPEWTSDGRILFTRDLFTPASASEWIVNADGTNERRLSLVGGASSAEGAPSGSRIVYSSTTTGPSVLRVAQLGKDGSVTSDVAITTPPNGGGGDFEAHWSPTGSDLVFLRDNNGDNDVFVVHSDGSGLKRLTNTPNRVEFWATWSSDGKEVIFQDGNTQKLRAINVATGQERLVYTWPSAPLSDDFGDGIRDASLWHQINDPGGTVSETGGQTVLSISAGAVPGGQFNQVDEHIGSQCSLVGDFDYQVDYSLLTWPHLGGFRANLAAFFANAAVGRASVATPFAPSWHDDTVQGYSDGGAGQFASSDSSGTLRLVRSGGIVIGYAKQGSGWRPVFSGEATGDTVYGMGLSAQASDFGHMDGSVAFDNFQVSSGTFQCPDWWGDSFSDVYFG